MKGAGGAKGHDGSDEKLYCQVAIEKRETLFINDPTKVPGLEKNEDWVKFGYGYYVGAPWTVGQTTGEGICSFFANTFMFTHTHIRTFKHAHMIIPLNKYMRVCTFTHTQVQWLLWRRSPIFLNQNTRPSLKSSETLLREN